MIIGENVLLICDGRAMNEEREGEDVFGSLVSELGL